MVKTRVGLVFGGMFLSAVGCGGADEKGGVGGDGDGDGVGDGDGFGDGDVTPGSGGSATDPGGSGGAGQGCAGEMCGGVCVDTMSDSENCGMCAVGCDEFEACQGGECVRIACPDDLALCDQDCFDTENDANHCGDCETVCEPTFFCGSSLCICSEERTECDGYCAHPDFDRQHCGGCSTDGGSVCEFDEACVEGGCETIGVPTNEYCGDTVGWDDASTALEFEVLDIVNRRRAEGAFCGGEYYPPAGPLQMEESLRCAARKHSQDMVVRDFFDHDNPDGQGPRPRLDAAGYSGGNWGENIAGGYSGPVSVMEGWMESSGHCRNIMNGDFTLIGIGHYTSGGGGGNHWTQTFGND